MFETLLISQLNQAMVLTIHRPQQRNSINDTLLKEMHFALDQAEHDPNCRFIILQGEDGFFCTGMDFQEVAQHAVGTVSAANFNSGEYMRLLKRLTTTTKVTIALLDGQVLAGGVGFAAASDIVLSTSRTQFGLSEALWGLLPACVLPFLIRRVGFQKAYYMTLTTQTITAENAQSIGLIDELSEHVGDRLRQLLVRLSRIQTETVNDLKAYFRNLWIINDNMEALAVAEINRLINKPQVQANIRNYIERQQFPWSNENKDVS